jgi:hypothetical protein
MISLVMISFALSMITFHLFQRFSEAKQIYAPLAIQPEDLVALIYLSLSSLNHLPVKKGTPENTILGL